jgi:APA family basic amino acid/polyamine antiporter
MNQTNHPEAPLSTSVSPSSTNSPKLGLIDALVIIVGIVVGAGIFRAPGLVATHTGSISMFFGAWFIGGLVSLTGALCYAELSTTYPNTGGDYHYLKKAYGSRFAFLFAWARLSVIQTGSIALLGFIVGDYLTHMIPLGPYSSSVYAASIVVVLTTVHALGLRSGANMQKLLIALQFAGILLLLVGAFAIDPSQERLAEIPLTNSQQGGAMGLALVFVLLTFGGWNEAGYISTELKAGSRHMVTVLVVSIALITFIYFLLNLAFLQILGFDRLSHVDAVGASAMYVLYGKTGEWLFALLIAITALTSVNATIFTGARTNYALGNDTPQLSFLGQWNERRSSPVHALWVQAGITLLLIFIGTLARNGFETMVEFTAPIFWFFFLSVGLSLFVLRQRDPLTKRPFAVPLYPVVPLLFCGMCAYLLYSSILYAGYGALLGIAAVLAGWILSYFIRFKA